MRRNVVNVPRFPLIGPLCRTRLPPSLRERTDLTLSETLVDETSVKVTASIHETPNKMKIADDVGPRHPSVTVARVQRCPSTLSSRPERSEAEGSAVRLSPYPDLCQKRLLPFVICHPNSPACPDVPLERSRGSANSLSLSTKPFLERFVDRAWAADPNQANDKGPKAGNGLLCSLKKDRQITAPYVDFLYG